MYLKKFIRSFIGILAILSVGVSYAGTASIEPIANQSFTSPINIGQTQVVRYQILNSTKLPITKINVPSGVVKGKDTCKYYPEVSSNCTVDLMVEGSYAGQEIKGIPEIQIGPHTPYPSKNGAIDVKIVKSPANVVWHATPEWKDQVVNNSSITKTYVVENQGQQTARFSTIKLDPNASNVAISGGTCVAGGDLLGGKSCTIDVKADLQSPAQITTALTVNYNDVTTNLSDTGKNLTSPINFAINARGTLEWFTQPTWSDLQKGGPTVYKSYQIQNTGGVATKITAIGFTPGQDTRLAIDGGSCQVGSILHPSSTCTINLKVDPNKDGKVLQALQIKHDGINSPLEGTISFDVIAKPEKLSFSQIPTWQDFTLGDAAIIKDYTVQNSGGEKVTLKSPVLNPNDDTRVAIIDGGSCINGKELKPNATCIIKVQANPTAIGSVATNLEVATQDTNIVPLSSLIHFTVSKQGDLAWKDFNEWPDFVVGQDPQIKTYELVNNGGQDITVNKVELNDPSSNLVLPNGSGSCDNALLKPHTTCTFAVRAEPKQPAQVAGLLTVTYDGNKTKLGSLNFNVAAPPNFVWVSKPSWPDRITGSGITEHTYTVLNNGGYKAHITNIDLDTIANKSIRSISDVNIDSNASTCKVGNDLNVAQTCTIVLNVDPQTAGSVGPMQLKLGYTNPAITSPTVHHLSDVFNFIINNPGSLVWKAPLPTWNNVIFDSGVVEKEYVAENDGSVPVKLKNIRLLPGESRLSIASTSSCYGGKVLNPGDTCTANIMLHPNSVGPISQELSIEHDGNNTPLTSAINFAVTSNVICWGLNRYGQLDSPPYGDFTQVSQGYHHTCGVRKDGSLYCWGNNDSGQSTPPGGNDFKQVGAGMSRSCALKKDGSIACWGKASAVPPPPASENDFTQISVAPYVACGLKHDGSIVCWGETGFATSPSGNDFKQVDAGLYKSCAIKSDGSIFCWGFSTKQPPAGTDYTQVESDFGLYDFGCALKNNGAVVCWGDNSYGQATPPEHNDFTQISDGQQQACGLRSDGSIACWGSQSIIAGTPDRNDFTQVSTGFSGVCAIANGNSN